MQRWLGVLPLLMLLWGQAQAADIEAGKAKAAVCSACHGVEGKALIPNYPHLAGQNAAYLVKQLKAFKEGSRKEPLMLPFMAPLTEADMENLAAYYASLK
ncbi:c-type cytochrome [Aeromonas bestiarum]|jgi:cytochrome c553|uniref:c-type cytochrome n=1 Tax=Aeromonas bestiarum TaxID=105751 RepID=UPI000CD432D3|nr:cytochrome c [Aeromonas bestiarum]EKP0278206.1 cytochrome c [Aeromonas bestiarum]POG22517.1 cytochrome C [Aeromonas bestiarum]